MRYLLFDRILEAERGRRMRAVKLVDLMDGYHSAHFPRKAVMPATLIIESLAQVGGMLNMFNHDFAVEMVLMLVEGARIFRQVEQGEILTLEVKMIYDHPYGATMQAEARAGDEQIADVDRIAFAHEITSDPVKIQNNRARFAYQSGAFDGLRM
jgi:3-hydroxymyristoyl/3-hydroxydecanoyl-(acyl carrier protein) dehydratases